jgi:methyl-accepting chemotaxis protein
MTVHRLLLWTHGLTALVAGGCYLITVGIGFSGWVAVPLTIVVTCGTAIAAVAVTSHQFRSTFARVEEAIAHGHSLPAAQSEFQQFATRLQEYVHRWVEAANQARGQTQEVESLLESFRQRPLEPAERAEAGSLLRAMLGQLAADARASLDQVLAGSMGIDDAVRSLRQAGTAQQGLLAEMVEAVARLATDLESLPDDVHDAEQVTGQVRTAVCELKDRAELVSNCLQRARGLATQGRSHLDLVTPHLPELASLAETIGDVATRMEMLALNATLESTRTDGPGQSLTGVAEELRQLAEQVVEATEQLAEHVVVTRERLGELPAAIQAERGELENAAHASALAQEHVERLLGETETATRHLARLRQSVGQRVEQDAGLVSSLRSHLAAADDNLQLAREAACDPAELVAAAARLTASLRPLEHATGRAPSTTRGSRRAAPEAQPDGNLAGAPASTEPAAAALPAVASAGSDHVPV